MEKVSAWREMLGRIIHDTHERQRLANMLSVSPVTLMRWANNTSSPRPQNIHHLLNALPEYRSTLLELLLEEFPSLSTTAEEEQKDFSQEIPSEFYTRVLNALATDPKIQRFWSISNLILQQALGQLDPNHL